MIKKMKKLELNTAAFVIAQIAMAVKDLHELGIVHRDIKSENIMVQPSGYIKLIDFGLSKELTK